MSRSVRHRNVENSGPGRVGLRRYRRLIAGLALVVVVGACSRRAEPLPIPNPAVDSRIHDEIQARIAAEPSLRAAQIRSVVEGARIQLYGSVDGIGAWNCALRNAWLVEGVQGVTEFLVIERGPPGVTCLAVRHPPRSVPQAGS